MGKCSCGIKKSKRMGIESQEILLLTKTNLFATKCLLQFRICHFYPLIKYGYKKKISFNILP